MQVLWELLDRQAGRGRQYARVLYIGDGRGDYCPSALLLHGCGGWRSSTAAARQPQHSGGEARATPVEAAAEGAMEVAAEGAAAAAAGGARAPQPCGSPSNVVFARRQYPDALPCSLWVMLREERHSSSAGGSSQAGAQAAGAAGEIEAAAARAAEAGAAEPADAQATGAGLHSGGVVVGWSQPEQLAQLLREELQLG